MLAGVLLHVIEAARPMDAAVNPPLGHGAVHHVNDAVFMLLNIEHIGIAQFAKIIRLPTGGGIQQGLVQKDTPARTEAVVLSLGHWHRTQHLGREVILQGIVVVGAVSCHRSILSQGPIALFSPHSREESGLGAKIRDKLEAWLSGSSPLTLTVRCSTAAGVCPTRIARQFREPPGAESRWH